MNDNDNANMYEIFERLNRVQSMPSKIDEAAAKAAEKTRLDEKYMGFEKTVKAVAKNPKVKDPEAVAAAIGRKKYGKEKFQKAAAAGKLTAQQLNIKPTVISSLQSKFPPGTDPKVDMLFQALGLYPTP